MEWAAIKIFCQGNYTVIVARIEDELKDKETCLEYFAIMWANGGN